MLTLFSLVNNFCSSIYQKYRAWTYVAKIDDVETAKIQVIDKNGNTIRMHREKLTSPFWQNFFEDNPVNEIYLELDSIETVKPLLNYFYINRIDMIDIHQAVAGSLARFLDFVKYILMWEIGEVKLICTYLFTHLESMLPQGNEYMANEIANLFRKSWIEFRVCNDHTGKEETITFSRIVRILAKHVNGQDLTDPQVLTWNWYLPYLNNIPYIQLMITKGEFDYLNSNKVPDDILRLIINHFEKFNKSTNITAGQLHKIYGSRNCTINIGSPAPLQYDKDHILVIKSVQPLIIDYYRRVAKVVGRSHKYHSMILKVDHRFLATDRLALNGQQVSIKSIWYYDETCDKCLPEYEYSIGLDEDVPLPENHTKVYCVVN